MNMIVLIAGTQFHEAADAAGKAQAPEAIQREGYIRPEEKRFVMRDGHFRELSRQAKQKGCFPGTNPRNSLLYACALG